MEEDLVEGEEDLEATVETEGDEAGEGPGGDGIVVDGDVDRVCVASAKEVCKSV